MMLRYDKVKKSVFAAGLFGGAAVLASGIVVLVPFILGGRYAWAFFDSISDIEIILAVSAVSASVVGSSVWYFFSSASQTRNARLGILIVILTYPLFYLGIGFMGLFSESNNARSSLPSISFLTMITLLSLPATLPLGAFAARILDRLESRNSGNVEQRH